MHDFLSGINIDTQNLRIYYLDGVGKREYSKTLEVLKECIYKVSKREDSSLNTILFPEYIF